MDVSASRQQEGQNPEHHLRFRSLIDLPGNFEFDSALRFVDRLNNTAVITHSYRELDLQLGWRPKPNLLLEVHGTSLFRPQHLEFPDAAAHRMQIERAAYAEAPLTF